MSSATGEPAPGQGFGPDGPPPPPPETPAPTDAHAEPPTPDTAAQSGETRTPDRASRSAEPPASTADGAADRNQASVGRRVVLHVRRQWARIPLRVRLLTVISILLVFGLGVVGAVTSVLFERHLIAQVDDRLRDNAASLLSAESLTPMEIGSGTRLLPTDYCFAWVDSTILRRSEYLCSEGTVEKNGLPLLTDAPISRTRLTNAFTTPGVPARQYSSTKETEPTWRVIGIPLTTHSATGLPNMAYIALPLTYTNRTANQVRLMFLLATIAVSLTGALLGYLAVRQSLKPLRRIEATAARIADGDLSARVPDMPLTTEVGSLAHSLNAMLAQIEAAFSARESSEARMRQFVSDASHELRTPLATIRGYGELYRMGALTDPESLDDTMRRIDDSSRRMASLVEDLLALARLDEGRALRREPVDLTALARDGVMDVGALDSSRPVRLQDLDGNDLTAADSPIPPRLVIGDEDRLRQVVMNLVGNVARHTPPGTPVEIAVGYSGDFGELSVIDHGPGVSPDQMQRLFERFYRADSSRDRRSGGSGLGLAIVAAIAGSLGGSARVSETPGGGLTVTVSIPALRAS